MLYLSCKNLRGEPEHINVILDLFGRVEFLGDNLFDCDIFFTVTHAFPNYYQCLPQNHPSALLYVLVPNKNIRHVWQGKNMRVDYAQCGMATICGKPITRAFAMTKNLVTLYCCLSKNGILIEGIGNLGI